MRFDLASAASSFAMTGNSNYPSRPQAYLSITVLTYDLVICKDSTDCLPVYNLLWVVSTTWKQSCCVIRGS